VTVHPLGGAAPTASFLKSGLGPSGVAVAVTSCGAGCGFAASADHHQSSERSDELDTHARTLRA
jgi:hypothetical protein